MEFKWTLISEIFPEPGTDVIVSYDNGEVEVINQFWAAGESTKYESWSEDDKIALAWMPLPPAYVPEQN